VTRAAALLVAALLALAGCGGGETVGEGAAPPEGSLPAVAGEERGRHVASRLGCVRCHRLGDVGKDGPGPELTRVGARLEPGEIRSALVDPVEPMPSFANVPAVDLDALVRYLAGLR
jgi:mono/diheme cytochrome c family protein